MKKSLFLLTAMFAFSAFSTDACAQGFLKKIGKVANDAEKVVGKAEQASAEVMTTAAFLESIPSYEIRKSLVGTNEDGTENYAYFVVDSKTGVIRNPNAVAMQYVDIAKSGFSLVATLKNASGLAKVKAAADAVVVGKEIASLIQQAKLMNAYKKTFTEEGLQRDAEVDLSNVDSFNFTESQVLEKSAEEVQKEVEAAKGEVDEDFDIMAALTNLNS